MKIIGVIPARYQSSRFPCKPLADTKIDEIYVATDDQKIIDVCSQEGIPSIITSLAQRI